MYYCRKCIRVAVFSCFTAWALNTNAQSYGNYDARKIITVSRDATGQGVATWNLLYLDQLIHDLELHAGTYPPKFDSDLDQKKAQDDLQKVIYLLGIMKDGRPSQNIMMRAANIYRIAHNLNTPNAAEKANSLYSELIAEYPSDPHIAFQYGVFLGEIGQLDQSIVNLNKALTLGETHANFSLGMAYLAQGHQDQALSYLRAYKKNYPEDNNVEPIIEAIESGQVKVVQHL
jgi:tetratricopeptide (TPR) repeat protein